MDSKLCFGAPRRLLKAIAVAAMLGGGLFAPAVQNALASDARCPNGLAGIEVWQDINLTGPGAVWCVAPSTGKYVINDLSTKTDNLGFFANWNDRITSYQTFNETSVGRACLVQDPNFNYRNAQANSTAQGNKTINYVGDIPNDNASSLEVANFNYPCATS